VGKVLVLHQVVEGRVVWCPLEGSKTEAVLDKGQAVVEDRLQPLLVLEEEAGHPLEFQNMVEADP